MFRGTWIVVNWSTKSDWTYWESGLNVCGLYRSLFSKRNRGAKASSQKTRAQTLQLLKLEWQTLSAWVVRWDVLILSNPKSRARHTPIFTQQGEERHCWGIYLWAIAISSPFDWAGFFPNFYTMDIDYSWEKNETLFSNKTNIKLNHSILKL